MKTGFQIVLDWDLETMLDFREPKLSVRMVRDGKVMPVPQETNIRFLLEEASRVVERKLRAGKLAELQEPEAPATDEELRARAERARWGAANW